MFYPLSRHSTTFLPFYSQGLTLREDLRAQRKTQDRIVLDWVNAQMKQTLEQTLKKKLQQMLINGRRYLPSWSYLDDRHLPNGCLALGT